MNARVFSEKTHAVVLKCVENTVLEHGVTGLFSVGHDETYPEKSYSILSFLSPVINCPTREVDDLQFHVTSRPANAPRRQYLLIDDDCPGIIANIRVVVIGLSNHFPVM